MPRALQLNLFNRRRCPQVAEKPVVYAAKPPSPVLRTTSPTGRGTEGEGELPPPPDNFPDGWEDEWQPTLEHAEIAARDKSKIEEKIIEPRDETELTKVELKVEDVKPIEAPREALALKPPLHSPHYLRKWGEKVGGSNQNFRHQCMFRWH